MNRNTAAWILTAPALIPVLILFFGGFGLGILQSFSFFPLIGLDTPNFSAYTQVLAEDELLLSLVLTLLVSLSATFLTIALAVTAALALRSAERGRRGILFLFQFPITVPHVIIALGALLLLSQSGFAARLTAFFGIISDSSDFPVLVNDRLGLGIIYVYLWKQIPFIGIIALSVLQSMGNDYEELARSLGAKQSQVLFHVILPLMRPALLPGSVLCFAFTFGSYEVPFLLGRSYPSMLPVLVYRYFTNFNLVQRPLAMALAVLITLFLLVTVILYKKFLGGRNRL
ncbi:MAG: ABC transporter permease subunit [Spirochaetales bacterium]|nr:ABC transporter permease subunit [Spirochaetales bacterium]